MPDCTVLAAGGKNHDRLACGTGMRLHDKVVSRPRAGVPDCPMMKLAAHAIVAQLMRSAALVSRSKWLSQIGVLAASLTIMTSARGTRAEPATVVDAEQPAPTQADPLPNPVPEPAPADPAPLPAATPDNLWGWATLKRRAGPIVGETPDPEVRSRWRGTAFDWSHVATSTLLGIGQDYQSSSYQIYAQGFTLSVAYHVIDRKALDLQLRAEPGLDVELTNSAFTTTRNEPALRDLPLGVDLGLPVHSNEAALVASRLRAALFVIAPVSLASRAAGYYATLSPRLAWIQRLPLRGGTQGAFDDLRLMLALRYDHLFSRATTSVNPELEYVRQDLAGRTVQSDLLDGGRLTPNTLRADLVFDLSEQILGHDLGVRAGLRYALGMLYGVSRRAVTTGTGQVEASRAIDASGAQQRLGVIFGVDFAVTNAIVVALGYESMADLRTTSNNPLYTPNAVFTGAISVRLPELFAPGGARNTLESAARASLPKL
jgi:hypothetical protein